MRPCCLRSGKAGMKTLIAVAPESSGGGLRVCAWGGGRGAVRAGGREGFETGRGRPAPKHGLDLYVRVGLSRSEP